MEVTYYLNERHPEGEEHCQFHGDILTGDMAEAKKAEIRERMLARQREINGKKKQVSIPNVPKRTEPVKKKPVASKFRIILLFYGIMLTIGVLFTIIAGIADFAENVRHDVVDVIAPEPEYFAQEAMEEDLEEWERTDDQVIALGEACNGFGHSDVVYDEVEAVLLSYMDEAELKAEHDIYSYNEVMDHYTWFETSHDFIIENEDGYMGILEISTDTATGQIHGFSMYTHGEDNFFGLADVVMHVINQTGISEETVPDGRTFYKEAWMDHAQEEMGYRMQYGLEVECLVLDESEEEPFYKMAIYMPGYYSYVEEY